MDAQTANLIEGIQNQNEGLILAMQANADVLQKMETHFQKMDEEKEKMDEEKEEEEMLKSKEAIMKEISIATLELLKKDNMVLNADKMHNVSHPDVFGRAMGNEDAQVDVEGKLRTDTGEVQKPIQAMILQLQKEMKMLKKHFTKEHASLYENDEEEAMDSVEEDVMTDIGDEDMSIEGNMEDDMNMEEDDTGMDDDWESTDYPMDEDDMDKMYKSMKKMSKKDMFKAMLKKQISVQNNVKSEAKKLSEKTLQKQGFRKEVSRTPRVIRKDTLGLDNNIVKNKNNKVVGEMDLMKELKDLSNPELYSTRDLINMRDGGDKPILTPELLEFYN